MRKNDAHSIQYNRHVYLILLKNSIRNVVLNDIKINSIRTQFVRMLPWPRQQIHGLELHFYYVQYGNCNSGFVVIKCRQHNTNGIHTQIVYIQCSDLYQLVMWRAKLESILQFMRKNDTCIYLHTICQIKTIFPLSFTNLKVILYFPNKKTK